MSNNITVQGKVKKTIGKMKGINPKDISIKDTFENMEMDSFDIDELIEYLSDYYGVDILAEFDVKRKGTKIGHLVKAIESLVNW